MRKGWEIKFPVQEKNSWTGLLREMRRKGVENNNSKQATKTIAKEENLEF